MAEVTKETITTQGTNNEPVASTPSTPSPSKASSTQTIEYVIYFLFGILEILLAFRFVLKLTGAGLGSGFVNFIYGLSGIFVAPFEGIFRMWFGQGSETTSVFEPSTLVALVVYAILAWGIVKIISISSGEKQPTD